MNNKDLRKTEMITARENVQNILSSKKKYFYPNKIDKNVKFIGAPYKIRTCDPRFRNARDWVYEWYRFTSFCYFTIFILLRVYKMA